MKGRARNPLNDKRKYPLRKVIERDVHVTDYMGHKGWSTYVNKLECGHFVKPATDFYGEIHSDSQRCKFCYKEMEPTELIKLENQVERIVQEDNASECTAHFNYKLNETFGILVNVTTYNPHHGTLFFLTKGVGATKEIALADAITKIKKKELSTYTVTWSKKSEGKTYISYFTAYDVYEVLYKFYFEKNKEDFIIFEIKLNPIS
jgi:hypothetical protein